MNRNRPTQARALTGNAADPEQVKKAGEREKDAAEIARDDMRAVLSTQSGRRFVWSLLSSCHVFSSIFVPSSEIYFRAGKHDFGLSLLDRAMDADPTLYLLMQREAANLDIENAEIAEPSTGTTIHD